METMINHHHLSLKNIRGFFKIQSNRATAGANNSEEMFSDCRRYQLLLYTLRIIVTIADTNGGNKCRQNNNNITSSMKALKKSSMPWKTGVLRRKEGFSSTKFIKIKNKWLRKRKMNGMDQSMKRSNSLGSFYQSPKSTWHEYFRTTWSLSQWGRSFISLHSSWLHWH